MLMVWDLQTGLALRVLKGHHAGVHGVAVTSDGRYLVSASLDHTLKIWSLATGSLLATLNGHSMPVHRVAVSPKDRHAVSASWDKTLKLWDLETLANRATFTCDSPAYFCVFAIETLLAPTTAAECISLSSSLDLSIGKPVFVRDWD